MVKSVRLAERPAKQMTFQKRIKQVPTAQGAFDSLLRSGCQPDKLWAVLESVFGLLENPDRRGPRFWRGYGKDFPQRLADVRAAAGVLETLNSSVLGRLFMTVCQANQRECLEAIPALLRGYSGWLERNWKKLPKQLGKSLSIAAVMQHIHRATGGWHDRELADLLAIAGDKFAYSTKDLKSRRSEWRRNPGFWEEAGALEVLLSQ